MRIIAIIALFISTSSVSAQAILPNESLSVAEARLSSLSSPSDDEQFALGAVYFLRGIEKTLQLRWQYNMALEDFDMPVLRLPIAPNPNAKPFEPALIAELFTELLADMQASRQALAAIPEGAEVALEIDLLTLWFDVNMNGTRERGEGVIEVGANTMMPRAMPEGIDKIPSMPVRFDSADVAWLSAYTHLLSGISELVIAFDPTEAITEVMDTGNQMNELRGQPLQLRFMPDEERWVDQFAMVYQAINRVPNAENTRNAHAHFLGMIAQNKRFWALLAAETDNVDEWIPNPQQTAALGFEMPDGTGEAWQAILSDAEAILNGELLVPHWRVSPGAGINVKKLFMEPTAVDIITWIHGMGLIEYMETGPVATQANSRRFQRLVSGNAFAFSLLLN